MTQYATTADMIARYDANLLGDLVSDNMTKVTPTDLLTNANLIAQLTDASASIDSAVRVGNRYTPSQMASLESSAASLVKRLTCDIAFMLLKQRRGRVHDTDKTLLEENKQRLKSLRDGEDYLMLFEQSEPEASVQELTGPELITVRTGPMLTIRESVRNYYPIMPGRWPDGRNGCE